MKLNQTKILQVGVKSILLNKENKILLLKRSLQDKSYTCKKEKWDLPGGRINLGSSLFSNLKREVFEETGLKNLRIVGLLGAQDIFNEDKHIVRLTYISRVTSKSVSLSDEHSEYEWLDLEQIPRVKRLDQYLKALLKDRQVMSFIKDGIKSR